MKLIVCKTKSFSNYSDLSEWILSAYSFAEKTGGRFSIQPRLLDTLEAEVKIFENEFTENS